MIKINRQKMISSQKQYSIKNLQYVLAVKVVEKIKNWVNAKTMELNPKRIKTGTLQRLATHAKVKESVMIL